jgi:hypothetical protein
VSRRRAVALARGLGLALLALAAPTSARGGEPICTGEERYFRNGSRIAGKPVAVPRDLAQPETLAAAGGATLCGYRIPARGLSPGQATRGYLLFAPGSGMTASRVVPYLRPFAEIGRAHV